MAHSGSGSLSKISEDTGTKLYGVSGKVNNPGCWELPIGVTVRELIEEHAGGMKNGYQFKGVLPGGASTDFLTAEHLDVKMDFVSVTKAGSRLGTGTMVVMDDATCPVGFSAQPATFFCAGKLWFLYALPGRIALGRKNVVEPGTGTWYCRRYRDAGNAYAVAGSWKYFLCTGPRRYGTVTKCVEIF